MGTLTQIYIYIKTTCNIFRPKKDKLITYPMIYICMYILKYLIKCSKSRHS